MFQEQLSRLFALILAGSLPKSWLKCPGSNKLGANSLAGAVKKMSEKYSERQNRLVDELTDQVSIYMRGGASTVGIPNRIVHDFVGDGDSYDALKITRKVEENVRREFPNAKYNAHGIDAGLFTNYKPETPSQSYYTQPKLFEGLMSRVVLAILIVGIPLAVFVVLFEGLWQILTH
jgi:hypothetical protein